MMMIYSNVSFQQGVILQNPFGKNFGINENVPSLYSFEIDFSIVCPLTSVKTIKRSDGDGLLMAIKLRGNKISFLSTCDNDLKFCTKKLQAILITNM